MISIKRANCPPELNTTRNQLRPNDYKLNNVINRLLDMQHHKCCFCESDLQGIGKSSRWVEHLIAKTNETFEDEYGNTNWNEANSWKNLLYSCSTCNSSKGTKKLFDNNGVRHLIDPSYLKIDPENHVSFIINGTAIIYNERNQSTLGRNTIENLKLKIRPDIYKHLRRSKRKIDELFDELVDALTVNNNAMTNSKLNDLSKKTSASEPHSSFARKYIRLLVDKFNNEDRILINNHLGTNIRPITINFATKAEVIT